MSHLSISICHGLDSTNYFNEAKRLFKFNSFFFKENVKEKKLCHSEETLVLFLFFPLSSSEPAVAASTWTSPESHWKSSSSYDPFNI